MPQHRRNSTGQMEGVDLPHLEEITETCELEEQGEQLPTGITCSAPKDVHCLRGSRGEHIFDYSSTVKLVCSNSGCTQSKFMHAECFEAWQNLVLNYLNKIKDGQRKVRNWSDKQKMQNIWKQGYHLVVEVCGCRCNQGHLRKDLNWISPKSGDGGQAGDQGGWQTSNCNEKHKRKRKKSSKNNKPALTIGLPTFGVNSSQTVKRSDAQGIPSSRQRTNSVSSTNSGSSSWGTGSSNMSSPTCSPPTPPGGRDHNREIPPRRSNMTDRSRHDSGGSIFLRRSDYSSFNVLPKSKINSYHIKMEDECSIGNDETRCFILSNYATNKMNRVPCVLCNNLMNIFERYPLIDGTFFLSPRQHNSGCIQVKSEGRVCYLSAVCMGCLEGWTSRLQCRNVNCLKLWDGSQLILGTMYSYDIFAAVPCCADRLKCTSCSQLVIHPEQRFNFFSDYSQTVSCPHCGVQDFHFTKPLEKSFLSKEDITRLRSNSGPGGVSLSSSWAQITANA